MKKSHQFRVNGSQVNQHGITFCPDFLHIHMTSKEAMQLIEQLGYKLSHAQPIELVYTVILQSEPADESRCTVCGWPLYPTIEEGCTVNSCSMRPRPDWRA